MTAPCAKWWRSEHQETWAEACACTTSPLPYRRGEATFELPDDGAVTRHDVEAIDIDLGPYTRSELYTYDGGRLVAETTTDSRRGSTTYTSMYAYTDEPGGFTVTRSSTSASAARWRYTFDAQDRLVRAEEDARVDGTYEWVVETTYDAAGGVTVNASRDGVAVRHFAFSSACGYEADRRFVPRSGMRPGTEPWLGGVPPVPGLH